MKKVLITGIDSFTGYHLSNILLESGYDIYGTTISTENSKTYTCNITNKNQVLSVIKEINPDFIIHLSAISFALHSHTNDFYSVNTIGTINILDALVELNLNPEKIILVSSATIYGNQGLEILDETLCPLPANHYGASKYSMECLAKNYFDKLNIIIVRPFNYTGKNQSDHFLIPKIVKHYSENKKCIELGNIDVIREFNDVGYVCRIYQDLLITPVNSTVVNVCSGRGLKLLDVIEIMDSIAGYSMEVKVNSDFVRENEIKSLTGSPEKLFAIIGFIEQKEFREVLKSMYDNS